MILSFFAALSLCLAVLGYFLYKAYSEERGLLVERIDAELNRLGSERLLRHLGVSPFETVDKRDTTLNLGTFKIAGASAADSISTYQYSPLTVIGKKDTSVDRIVIRDGVLSSLQISDRDYTRLLDSLSAVFDVTLHEVDAGVAQPTVSTVMVRANKGILGLSGSGVTGGVAMSGYRTTVIRGIALEIFFSLLIMVSIATAGLLAYRNQREYREQLRQKDLLLANLSHELKSPIAAVGVALEALDSFGAGDRPELRRRYIQMSRAELARLDQLADYSLSVLKTGGSDRLAFTEVDLVDTVEAARVATLSRYSLAADLIRWEPSRPGPARVRGLPQELRVAVLNLLDNAVKYGGHPPLVVLSLRQSDGQYALAVHDNGRGVPVGEAERIFESFYRANNKEEGHVVKGQGLGLSLVRQIADLHGGRVSVRNTSGMGAIFTLNIPAR